MSSSAESSGSQNSLKFKRACNLPAEVEEYLKLRQRSSDLTLRRPICMNDSSDMKTWSQLLKKVLSEGESAVHSLLRKQGSIDYSAAVNDIMNTIREELLTVGRNIILNISDGERYDCVITVSVTDFWSAVDKFMTALLSWTEAALVKILSERKDAKKKDKAAVHGIFYDALDLLWGIYA